MAESKPIRNIFDLTMDLVQAYNDLRDGNIEAKEAKDKCAVANSIIASCKLQLEYHKMSSTEPSIPFLEPHIDDPGNAPTLERSEPRLRIGKGGRGTDPAIGDKDAIVGNAAYTIEPHEQADTR